MRISDWSSDVCSSDLAPTMPTLRERPDFTYGNTRLRARRDTLLGPSLEQLPHHDLDQLLAALDATPYAHDVDAAAHAGGLARLHLAVTTHLTRALHDAVSHYEGDRKSTRLNSSH